MIPYSRPKRSDLYTLSWSKLLKNHTLHSDTYLYSPYMAVPPPPPGSSLQMQRARGVGGGMGVGPAENASSFFAAFCDSQKTLEKMAQPSHPCLNPAYTPAKFLSCLFLPLDSRVSPLLAAQTPSDSQTIQHVYWLEPLLSMSVCKKGPLRPFLSPEWRLVVSTNFTFYFINWTACDEPSS